MEIRQILDDAARVEAALTPSSGGARLTLSRAWPLAAGGACTVWVDGTTGRKWSLLVAQREVDRRRLSRAVAVGLATRCPDLEAHVLEFPSDPALPRLAAFLDPTQSCEGLPAASCRQKERRQVAGYKPLRRCVVRLRGSRTRYVKFLRPRATRRLGELYRHLAKAGGLRFAAPKQELPGWGALVWERTGGRPLTAALRAGAADDEVAATGRNLAALHAAPLRLPAVRPRRREFEALRSWFRLARHTLPDGGVCADLLADLEEAGASLPPGRMLPVHCDFHDGQVLVDADEAVFLDFDTAAQAEPELDVGNFLAHLELRSIERPETPVEQLAAVFLRAYRSSGGPSVDVDRLDWYRRCALLRLICVYEFRPGGRSLGQGLLECLHRESRNGQLQHMEVT